MVPAVAHFIWYGPRFPWVNAFAIRSAATRGGFERVVLHHDRPLAEQPAFAALAETPGFEARRLDPPALFASAAGDRPGLAAALTQLHGELDQPNARANVVRAAILAAEGGVYLDTDTVTVADLGPLRTAGVFVGRERVVLPAADLRDRRWHQIAKRLALMGIREGFRRWPSGWRSFRRVEGWYPEAVNNAVAGAAPGHPFVRALLQAMVTVPWSRRKVPYALGTHLLQDRVAVYAADDLVVHPPPVFFPLGPEISHHWFRLRANAAEQLDEVVVADTRVVHWYASVRTKQVVPKIDPSYVRTNADRQLFSALARPVVEEAGW